MSLKGFHILFITIATLLCVFIVVWAFVLASSAGTGLKVFGGTCAVAAIILPIYGVSFYKKAKVI
ncbi:MAG: hypothetical protein QNL01_10675 [Akkermansiaceae bacterium]|jgi:hypothetical protein|tara:strand:- start:4929 stop:5123 length:195 start_codon:yes stop_codon:yes gene_type:complete